jgi:hypothetical protein
VLVGLSVDTLEVKLLLNVSNDLAYMVFNELVKEAQVRG